MYGPGATRPTPYTFWDTLAATLQGLGSVRGSRYQQALTAQQQAFAQRQQQYQATSDTYNRAMQALTVLSQQDPDDPTVSAAMISLLRSMPPPPEIPAVSPRGLLGWSVGGGAPPSPPAAKTPAAATAGPAGAAAQTPEQVMQWATAKLMAPGATGLTLGQIAAKSPGQQKWLTDHNVAAETPARLFQRQYGDLWTDFLNAGDPEVQARRATIAQDQFTREIHGAIASGDPSRVVAVKNKYDRAVTPGAPFNRDEINGLTVAARSTVAQAQANLPVTWTLPKELGGGQQTTTAADRDAFTRSWQEALVNRRWAQEDARTAENRGIARDRVARLDVLADARTRAAQTAAGDKAALAALKNQRQQLLDRIDQERQASERLQQAQVGWSAPPPRDAQGFTADEHDTERKRAQQQLDALEPTLITAQAQADASDAAQTAASDQYATFARGMGIYVPPPGAQRITFSDGRRGWLVNGKPVDDRGKPITAVPVQ